MSSSKEFCWLVNLAQFLDKLLTPSGKQLRSFHHLMFSFHCGTQLQFGAILTVPGYIIMSGLSPKSLPRDYYTDMDGLLGSGESVVLPF